MKKTLSVLLGTFILNSSFAAPVDADLDLSSYENVVSGSYDLDHLLSTRVVNSHNVAGIYQVNNGFDELGSKAEIQQIDGVGNRAMVWQSAYSSSAQIIQTDGINNLVRLVQTGSGHMAKLAQTDGSANVMTVRMLGANAQIDVTQFDARSNVLDVTLNTGSQLKGTQTGLGNNFSVEIAPNISVTFTQTGVTTPPP
jgi:hypothetical protein